MDAQFCLKNYQLRTTSIRLDVLNIFGDSDIALSEKDLEETLKNKYDRVTIYRTLSTFCKKRLLHKVIDDSNIVKYAICRRECSPESHCHNHLHFKCEVCSNTYCFDEIPVPSPPLPKEYKIQETNLLAVGICKVCNLNN